MKAGRRGTAILFLFLLTSTQVRGQSALDGFDPNANGNVNVVVQPDGKILAGGVFTSIGGQTRNRLARPAAITGAADLFDPNASAVVNSIAVQPDGKILAGGSFISFMPNGGAPVTRNRIARLKADGTLVVLKNDDYILGGAYTARTSFQWSEAAGAKLTAQATDYPYRIEAIQVLVADSNPGGSASDMVTIDIYQDNAGTANPGPLIFSSGGTTYGVVSDSINEIDLTAESIQVASGSIRIAISLVGNDPPTVGFGTDTNGIQSQRNYVRRANGTWSFAENPPFGINGDWIIRGRVRVINPPAPTGAVSRKLHGGTPFDINLPFTGNSGVECRSGGATNDYSVVFTFPDPVTFSAAFVSGTGSISGTTGSGTTTITVNLTGVTNTQTIGVTLFGVNNGMSTSDVSVPMGVLVGDTNADRFVNAGDALQTRNRSGQATDATNFRSDVNGDGFVNSGDTIAVRSRSGTALP